MREPSKSSVYVLQPSWTNVSLNCRGEAAEAFDSYGDAYHRAGRILFETFARDPERAYEADAIPIAFLYRHAAELYLKAIVRRGNVLLSMAGHDPTPVRAIHSLIGLLDDVRPVFHYVSPNWEAERQAFRRLVADLERDTTLGLDDGSGDMWRYPVRRNDTNHLPDKFAFDVKTFVERLDEFLNTLSGAITGINEHIDNLGQDLYYAQQDNQYWEDCQEERG